MNDKMLHMLAGFIIALLAIIITNDIVVGLLASFVAGAAKEIWDYFGQGTTEKADLLATVQGGFVGCLFMLALRMLR